MRPRELQDERGQALVEFAIILPIALLLVVGMVQVGIAFNYWISLNHLSNEGARWVAVDRVPPGNPSPTINEYKVYIRDQIITGDLRDKVSDPVTDDPTGIDICLVGDATPEVGDAVRVTIKAPYSMAVVSGLMDLGSKLFGNGGTGVGDLTLSGSSTVRLEQPPSVAGQTWDTC